MYLQILVFRCLQIMLLSLNYTVEIECKNCIINLQLKLKMCEYLVYYLKLMYD